MTIDIRTLLDELPDEPLNSVGIAEVDDSDGIESCEPIFGLSPEPRNELVAIVLTTSQKFRVIAFGSGSWKIIDETQHDGGNPHEFMMSSAEDTIEFILANHDTLPELVFSERPPHEEVLDVVSDAPIQPQSVSQMDEGPGYANAESLFRHAKTSLVIGFGITRVPLKKDEVPIHFLLGYHPDEEEWKVVDDRNIVDGEMAIQEEDGEMVVNWFIDKYGKENLRQG